jgi:molybdopterin-guanine dinucleotide biosynthesis protein A
MLPALEEDIKRGKYKLAKCLEKVTCKMISTSSADMDDSFFMNINNEEDYRNFKGRACTKGAMINEERW